MASSSLLSAAAKRLDGRVAIITGGVGGIGSAIAKLFCQHGAKVLIADTRDDESQSMCKDLGHGNSFFVHCDVTSESDVQNAVNKAVSTHGRLDIMVNNAGIAGAKGLDILDCDGTDFVNVFRVNTLGAFLGTKHAARVMKPKQRGSIINTASVAGAMGGLPHAYTCSKHAIVGLTKNTALDLGRYGIRVNCVSPYILSTQMTRNYFGLAEDDKLDVYSNLKGVDLMPEDVAEAVLYLASDESKCVSGHNLVVDAGFSISNLALNMFNQ
ncbi:PREDICTED: secoisolariciresinol dehydrogenase-like [Ipomoea nil]|uniref:secoisolariciresinol dehydrogenase-like n=1 Tax=Ipomoea nil TaxID=35883 RepID=UPI000900C818|nr:PREDICTED: secoisolariciresinol dehydrogenase-like [Ipomoea nil]XP_019164228.1 PREDICTED: secoisolariciresinol dehydrogenase-like [Ipomoea nil]